LTFAAIVLFGYLLGSCPWGYWLVRIFRHEDIRQRGSGNIGVSNVWRLYGRSLAIPILFLDFGKGLIPALLGVVYVSHLCGVIAGAAAMAGHWRPLFMGFSRGGKMVATGGGVLFAVAPLVAISALGLWAVVFFAFGYSSVASLCTAVYVPFGSWLFHYPTSVVVFSVVAAGSVFVLHRENLSRLWRRTEHRSSVALTPRLLGPRRN
jgi:acyl phosphate:glycerol-3-phosphate acyltransferase